MTSDWDHPRWSHLTDVEKKAAGMWLHVNPSDKAVLEADEHPLGLLVGEQPSSGSGALPLFPHPKNSAGGRLLLWSRMTAAQYLGRIRRVNIFLTATEEWDPAKAVERAKEIEATAPVDTRIVLLGQKVSEAFEMWIPFKMERRGNVLITSIPHPSGRNLIYNDAVARMGACAAVQWAANAIVPPTDKEIKRAEQGKRR